MTRPRWMLVAAMASSACGGAVDLGGTASDSSLDGRTEPDAGPYSLVPEAILELTLDYTNDIAVTTDKLYMAGYEGARAGLFSCQKNRCQATFRRLPNISENVHTLQVYEQRLAVAAGEGGTWLGSYALPNASDRKVTIDDLPSTGYIEPLFHRGFVYWSLELDQANYRCALPDCPNGPTLIGSAAWMHGDGELIFWAQDGYIHRAAQLGDAPAQRLLPDATLSEAPANAEARRSSDYVFFIATSGGLLYAGLQSDTLDCGGNSCVGNVVRWPVGGGAKETVVNLQQWISRLFVFDSELVWVSRHADDWDRGTLSSCHVQACEATRRDLGLVASDVRGVVADAHYLYWLETGHRDPVNFANLRVRRVARLGPP